jgi:diguanylate cyclase (GGDEF)-like protein/PAS domain S-box-containing protein
MTNLEMRDNDKTKRQLMDELKILRDRVAELKRIEAAHDLIELALRESEARYHGLFDDVPVALYRTTTLGQFLDANPAMIRMMGYPDRTILISINAAELYANADDRSRWQALMEQDETVKDFEFQARRYDGAPIWLKNTARAIKDGAGRVLCYEGSLEDITFRKQAQEELAQANEGLKARLTEIGILQEQLRERAIRDPLTNLFNRRNLEETLDQELAKADRKAYPVSLIMMDIDHFKCINDTYGHKAGDQALQSLADFIRSRIRSSDTACRFGGDEFVIVMPETSLRSAYERAEGFRQKVQSLQLPDIGIPGNLAVSIGIATYPIHGATKEELLRAADQALYLAKAQGRNRVVVAQE